MEKGRLILAKEIVKKYNISYQTLNYYTNIGLLKVIRRKGNGRLYDREEIERRLQKIRGLKNEGYPLRIISKML